MRDWTFIHLLSNFDYTFDNPTTRLARSGLQIRNFLFYFSDYFRWNALLQLFVT